jgi:hypothetical protein
MKITDFVAKDRYCYFRYYRKGFFYYSVIKVVQDTERVFISTYQFPIPLDDLGDATLQQKEKSTFLMRYIRKALEEGTLVKMDDVDNVPQSA